MTQFLSHLDAAEIERVRKSLQNEPAAVSADIALPSGRAVTVHRDGRLEEQFPTSETQLVAGKWYALAFRNFDGELDWNGARLLEYHGDGYWTDETGAEVERIWDPIVQTWIAPGAVDAFMVQS